MSTGQFVIHRPGYNHSCIAYDNYINPTTPDQKRFVRARNADISKFHSPEIHEMRSLLTRNGINSAKISKSDGEMTIRFSILESDRLLRLLSR